MAHHIKTLVESFHGYTYEMAGMIAAFFDDPYEAKACAEHISQRLHKPVEVNGTSLVVVL